MSTSPSAALLVRLTAGDTHALGEVYDRYAGLVNGLALRILRDRAEAIRRSELLRYEGRWESLSERDRELVERLTRSIVRKLLHEPTVRLRDGAIDREGRDLAAAVHELFDLPGQ